MLSIVINSNFLLKETKTKEVLFLNKDGFLTNKVDILAKHFYFLQFNLFFLLLKLCTVGKNINVTTNNITPFFLTSKIMYSWQKY